MSRWTFPLRRENGSGRASSASPDSSGLKDFLPQPMARALEASMTPKTRENTLYKLVTPRDLFSSPHPEEWEGQCRRLSFGTYMGDDIVLCRTLARFKMYVSTRDEGLAPHLIGDGFWEMWVTKVMTDVVMPGMVCIDAGANLGYYAVLLGELTGRDGKVVAIEPMPGTRRLLERNVAINGFSEIVDIQGFAVGEGPGTVTLYMPPGEPKNALICLAPPHPDWESATVPVVAIDGLKLPRVDFVKIDVEGAEIDVWHGMFHTIMANPQIQIMMEVNCRRYPDLAEAFMAEITNIFPLRHVTYSGSIEPISLKEVLNAWEDVMLFLKR